MTLSTNKEQVPLTFSIQGVHCTKYSYPTVDLYGIPNTNTRYNLHERTTS